MNKSVTVYTTSTCPYCDMVKKFLDEQNVSYKEVNIQNDPEAAKRLVETTGQLGVPQTEIDGKWIIGFDPNSIMEVIKQ